MTPTPPQLVTTDAVAELGLRGVVGMVGAKQAETERLDALLSKKRMTDAEKNEARELLGWNTPKACKYCGDDVGMERRCFAVPVRYRCLPPPEPLRTVRGWKPA